MGLDMYLIAKARPVGDLYINEEFNKKMNGNCWFVYHAWW